MLMEWCFLGGLCIVSYLLISRGCRSKGLNGIFLGGTLLLVASSLGWGRYSQRQALSRTEFRQRLPQPQKSECVSSANCRSCQPSRYAAWHRSFHRTMTQVASPETVRGNFT